MTTVHDVPCICCKCPVYEPPGIGVTVVVDVVYKCRIVDLEDETKELRARVVDLEKKMASLYKQLQKSMFIY